MSEETINCRAVCTVRFQFKERGDATNQWRHIEEISVIEMFLEYLEALDGLNAGDDIFVLCWFDRSDRSILRTWKRGEITGPLQGVFSIWSPARPRIR